MSEAKRPWLPLAIVALAALAALYFFLRDEAEPVAPGEPRAAVEGSETDSAETDSAETDSAETDFETDSETASDTYDDQALAALIFDGGVPPGDVPAYDPEPTAPELGAPGSSGSDPTAPDTREVRPTARLVPGVREQTPPTPRQRLRRARFFEGILEQRAEQLRVELEAARATGDSATEERVLEVLEELDAHRPALTSRIRDLEAAVPDEETQGEY